MIIIGHNIFLPFHSLNNIWPNFVKRVVASHGVLSKCLSKFLMRFRLFPTAIRESFIEGVVTNLSQKEMISPNCVR